jgi:hypothetical protein
MFETTFSTNNTLGLHNNQAIKLFRQAVRKGGMGRLFSRISGQTRSLRDLQTATQGLNIRSRHYAGVQAVLISKIVGSEGRVSDFDASFNPLSEKTRDRWLSVASARLQGRAMPAVELIQVGELYYVRDGHHRISVARAFEEEAIDAQVTVWEVRESQPFARSMNDLQLCPEAV